MNDGFYDIDYLNKKEAVYEDEFLRHVRFEKSLLIIIEGQNNKAAVFKEEYILKNESNQLEDQIEEAPPEGFM
jgi:hypothetical protein